MAEQTELSREARIAALAPLPEGSNSRYIYNRTNEHWEGMFDNRVYEFQPHEVRVLSAEIAEHLHAHSLIPGTLRRIQGGGGTLTAERYLALGPGWKITGTSKIEDTYYLTYGPAEAEATFLVPTETKASLDYFDRSSIPNYVDRPNMRDPGKPTHSEIIRV